MNDENKKEMEQIQRGLEAFLEHELENGQEDRPQRNGAQRRRVSGDEAQFSENIEKSYGGQAGRGEDNKWEAARGFTGPENENGYFGPEYEEPEHENWDSEVEYEESEQEDWDSEAEYEESQYEEPEYEDWDGGRKSMHTGIGEDDGKGVIQSRRSGITQNDIVSERGEEGSMNRSGKTAQSGGRRSAGQGGQSGRTGQNSGRGQSGRTGQDSGRGQSGSIEQAGRGRSGQRAGNSQTTSTAKRSSKGGSAKQSRSAKGNEEEINSRRSKGKKGRKRKSGFCKFLIVVALLLVVMGVGLYQLVGVVYAKMNFKEVASVADLPMKEDGVINILLIGNDSRENGDDGRSDAMILLSVSSKTKTIYMTSLLRDIYVEIPGHDGNRLNAAYSFGGAELLMETIEKNFDIPVNRYVLVNFEAFASLVDAVGGIELELTKEEIEYVNGYLVEYNMLTGRPQGTDNMDTSQSGLVHLNGPQALAYSRNRYIGTDFGRTERQRKVLTAVIKKLPMAVLTSAGELMDGLLPNLTTNLTRNECFRLSLMAGKLLTYEIVSDNIPQPNTYQPVTIRKMEVLEVDFDTNIKYLKKKLYGE